MKMPFTPIEDAMRHYGAPANREEYLLWAYGDSHAELNAEEEAELPEKYQRETLESMPQETETIQ